jgi:hypothetical protein
MPLVNEFVGWFGCRFSQVAVRARPEDGKRFDLRHPEVNPKCLNSILENPHRGFNGSPGSPNIFDRRCPFLHGRDIPEHLVQSMHEFPIAKNDPSAAIRPFGRKNYASDLAPAGNAVGHFGHD